MARVWTIPFEGGKVDRPSSSYAQQDEVPTTLHPCDAFDPSTDESVILAGTLPAEYASGTMKLDILYCSNTTTAADDVRFDAATEFKTPGAAEAMNSSGIDGTPDSVTGTHSTTAYSLRRVSITLTPGTAAAAGDRFRIQVTRDADHSTDDSLAADCLVVGYEFYEEA